MKVNGMKKNDLSSIVVKGTDWFANLAVLNLCWLLFSLPVVTLIPATDAVFNLINKWVLEGQPSNVFKSFIASFKENFGKSFRWGIPLLLVTIILIIDLYFLNQLMIPSAWFSILKYAFYTFACSCYFIWNSCNEAYWEIPCTNDYIRVDACY